MLGILCAVVRHRARWLTRDDVANDDEQVREILQEKYKVDIEKYKSKIREY